MTLHSWGAIAPTVDNIDKLIKYIRTARPALLRWKTTQILIIDEGTLFTKRVTECPLNWKSIDGGWPFIRENCRHCHSTQEEDGQAIWRYPGRLAFIRNVEL
jgi:hypothetical protein